MTKRLSIEEFKKEVESIIKHFLAGKEASLFFDFHSDVFDLSPAQLRVNITWWAESSLQTTSITIDQKRLSAMVAKVIAFELLDQWRASIGDI